MDLIGIIVSLGVSLVLIVACGAFVAAEFSLITANRNDVEAAVESGDKRARGVLQGMKTLSTQLSGAQLGITVTNLGIGFLAEPAIAAIVGPPLTDAGLSAVMARTVSIAIALVLATGMTMIFGELVPKNMAIAQPLRTAKMVVGFQRAFTTVLSLPIRLFNGNANVVVRALGVEPQEELGSARSADELSVLVRRSAAEGAMAAETAHLVQRTLAFGDRRAHDAMVPRGRMEILESEDSVEQLLDLSRTTGHSRFPVLTDEGDVIGIAHIRHGLAVAFTERPETAVDTVMGTATFVPDTVPLDDLMDTLRAGGLQMAVVVDEFGDTAGLITLEDLVEEIVGEVRDEHDEDELEARVEPDGDWTLPGLLRIDEVADLTEIDLPHGEAYDTVAGLLADQLDRLPEVGDVITVRAAVAETGDELDVTVQVTAMDRHRVDEVRLHAEPAKAKEAAE